MFSSLYRFYFHYKEKIKDNCSMMKQIKLTENAMGFFFFFFECAREYNGGTISQSNCKCIVEPVVSYHFLNVFLPGFFFFLFTQLLL